MRLTRLELSTKQDEVISLSLSDFDEDSNYRIRDMTGLDADDITQLYYGTGLVAGTKFYEFGVKPREISMVIALNPSYTNLLNNSDLRDKLYRMISATRNGTVDLRLYSGPAAVAAITGFITKVEVPHFSKRAEVQITIYCEDGIFRGVSPIIFAQPEIAGTSPISLPDSLSTCPHGAELLFEVLGNTASFELSDDGDDDWSFSVVPGLHGGNTGFLTGDALYISSVKAERDVYITRGETVYHVAHEVVSGSVWPVIFPGSNVFRFFDPTKFALVAASYYPAYWGV